MVLTTDDMPHFMQLNTAPELVDVFPVEGSIEGFCQAF
jgi:hypothetical protein